MIERLLLAITLTLHTCAFDRVEPEAPGEDPASWAEAPADVSLRELGARAELRFGTAVDPAALAREPDYAALVARHAAVLTPENQLKWELVHPEPGRFDFSGADAVLAFAEAHDMSVRGHTLVWHRQLPSWLSDRDWTATELDAVLADHIRTVMGRYRGRIRDWDVVNEAVSDWAGGRDTIWRRVLGRDWVARAFELAHAADPEARLFYNDYGAEGTGPKGDRVYRLVEELVRTGVPIHGVGLQGHVFLGVPSRDELAAQLARLAALGLEIQLSEVDVPVPDPATPERRRRQAIAYRRLLDGCLAVPRCTTFVTWGITDRHSWVPAFLPGFGSALPFDAALRPKPAFQALADGFARPRPARAGVAAR